MRSRRLPDYGLVAETMSEALARWGEDGPTFSDPVEDRFGPVGHAEALGGGPGGDLRPGEVHPPDDQVEELELEGREQHRQMGSRRERVFTVVQNSAFR